MKQRILLLMVLVSSFAWTTDYNIINRIDFDTYIGDKVIQLSDNNFICIRGKSIDIISIQNNDINVLDSYFSTSFFTEEYFLTNNTLYVSTSANGFEVYNIDDSTINFVTKIGAETDEYKIIMQNSLETCDSKLISEYINQYNDGSFDVSIDIYDINDNYTLLASQNYNEICTDIFTIGDHVYFIRMYGTIEYTQAENLIDLETEEVSFSGVQDHYIWSSYYIDGSLYIYFTDFVTGVLKKYSFQDTAVLTEDYSIPLPAIPNLKVKAQDNELILWGKINSTDSGIQKYEITNNEWELINEVTFAEEHIGDFFTYETGYIVFTRERICIMDQNFEVVEELFENYRLYPKDIILSRYLILQKRTAYSSEEKYIFDLEEEQFLDIELNSNWYYSTSRRSYYEDKAVFLNGNQAKIVFFDETGISEVFDLDYEHWIYLITFAENTLAVTYQNESGNFAVSCYDYNNGNLELIAENEFSSSHGKPVLIDDVHILISFSGNNITTNDYYSFDTGDFEFLTSFETESPTTYFYNNKLIYQSNEVYIFSDIDNPVHETTISESYVRYTRASYNGYANLLFESMYRVSVFDDSFNHVNTFGEVSYSYFLEDDKIVLCEDDHLTIAELPFVEFNEEDIPVVNQLLLLNYPNPFNPSTEIRYRLSEIRDINSASIEIYNVKGQLVDSLPVALNGVEGSVTWNANRFASGVYFYKLSVDGKQEGIKKMLLLK